MGVGWHSRFISTLNPKRLRPSDCIDLSGKLLPSLTLSSPGRTELLYGYGAQGTSCNRLRFPPDVRGFLYYHTPPKAPPHVGEIRFRLANDPDKFHDGEDLLTVHNTPWSISLSALANQSTYLALRHQLLADGLISQSTVEKWAKSKQSSARKLRVNYPVLHYLSQPFHLRFSASHVGFYTATREQIGLCYVLNLLRDNCYRDIPGRNPYPYGGWGLVQFEPYGQRLAMRVLKIVEPVQDLVKDYDGYIVRPVEGELVTQWDGRGAPTVVTRRVRQYMKMLPVNFEDLP